MEEIKKSNNSKKQEPYKGAKVIVLLLSIAVQIMCVLFFAGAGFDGLVLISLFVGATMCGLSGIIEISKDKKIRGYFCAILAGIFLVASILKLALTFLGGV